jgi:hypothetical protein
MCEASVSRFGGVLTESPHRAMEGPLVLVSHPRANGFILLTRVPDCLRGFF